MSFHFPPCKTFKNNRKKMVSVHFAYTASGFTVSVTFFHPPILANCFYPPWLGWTCTRLTLGTPRAPRLWTTCLGRKHFRRGFFCGGKFVFRDLREVASFGGKLKKKMKRPNSHFERRGGKYGSYRSFFLVSKNFKKTVQKK